MKLPNIKNKVFYMTTFAIGYLVGHSSDGFKPLFLALFFMIIDFLIIVGIIELAKRAKFHSKDKDITNIIGNYGNKN